MELPGAQLHWRGSRLLFLVPDSLHAVRRARGHVGRRRLDGAGAKVLEPGMTTRRLKLVPKTLPQVHAQIAAMTPDQRAMLSRDWLAQLASPAVDTWTLGFAIVEIAYGVNPDQQGKGYATEAAEWLVAYAFGAEQVRRVRAHTLSATNAS